MDAGKFKQGDPEVYGDIYWHYLLGNIMEIIQECQNSSGFAPSLDAILELFSF